jgi:arylsulfatase A-like enzyme
LTAKVSGSDVWHPTRRDFLTLSAGSVLGASCATLEPSGEMDSGPQRPNVVVFVSDTLRADHLSCYGYGRPTTPAIDRFSERSILFEQCHAGSTWTTPSTATIVTGTSPLVHRTVATEWSGEGRERGMYHVLSENIPTTAECLAAKRYRTSHFQANPNADGRRGHGRGCQDYFYETSIDSTAQMDEVLAWLSTRAREPFYLYVHMLDPHKPHRVSPELFSAVHGEEIEDSIARIEGTGRERLETYHTLDWMETIEAGNALLPGELKTFSASAMEHLLKLYDAEIRGIDQEFGRLVAGLEERGLMDNTVLAFTSDHGEAFGEDGHYNHGYFIHDAQTHVPMMIHVPWRNRGERVPWTVRLSDLHPTLLTLADTAIPAPCTGATLLDRDGGVLVHGDRAACAALDHSRSVTKNWLFGMAKGALRVRMLNRGGVEVYEMVGGPGGVVRHNHDVESREPRIRSAIQQLYGIIADDRRVFNPDYRPKWGNEQFEQASQATLESLGYL